MGAEGGEITPTGLNIIAQGLTLGDVQAKNTPLPRRGAPGRGGCGWGWQNDMIPEERLKAISTSESDLSEGYQSIVRV